MSVTTHDISRMIAQRHGINTGRVGLEWALFYELTNGTGFEKKKARYVDAFAMHLWPSKGHHRVAYEIKVSRSDFLRELAQPGKRAWAWGISHEFWFACAPGVAKPEEIPEGCGLLEARGDKLIRKVAAQQRQPRDLTMNEVAAFARQCTPGELFASLRWRYAGRLMEQKQLDELIASERSRAEQEEIERRVDEEIQKRLQKVRDGLEHYAEALRSVGVVPPTWMTDPRALTEHRGYTRGYLTDKWCAEHWVRDQIHPGPNLQDVEKSVGAAEQAAETLLRALEVLHQLRTRKVNGESLEGASHARA